MNIVPVETLEPELQFLIQTAPFLKKLFLADVAINVTNLEQMVYQLDSKELIVPGEQDLNRKFTEQDPIIGVMRSNRPLAMTLTKDMYGLDMFLSMIPISNSSGKVVGGLTISYSIQNRVELSEIAEKFAVSSEQIGSSTVDLSSTAQDLTNFMEVIAQAQSNLTTQVNDSTKILEMINSVAKSTRILGFNAGIEAARSGEHGKGFAVVAKEITKLADQSSEAVNEIHKLLNSMKEKVEEVTVSVTNTINVANIQTSTLHEIADSIKHLTDVAEQIDVLAQKV